MDAAAPLATVAAPSPVIAQRPDPSARIERVFAEIHATRMQGMPFVNPALRVEAVGFRRWDGRWLGVLITPWFMNLMLVPDADAGWHHVRYGDSVSYALPAGVFEFISAREPMLGDYQMCSLFSPMFEFVDPDGARATAVAALAALFDAQSRAGAEGPGTALAATTDPAAGSAPRSDAAPAPAVSKRDFLRGRWLASRGE